jgi:hypothetical protein
MTWVYNAYFSVLWLTAILAVPTSVGMAAWAVGWYWVYDRVAIGVSIALVGLVWTVYLRLHGPRVLVRAGAFPAFCMGDAFPRTEEQLIDAVAKMYARNGRPPEVVGSGWAYFLYRRGARGPRVFLHTFKGRQPVTGRWRSGTTIAQVNFSLRDRNLTFNTHPTMDYISLGSWFACSNHGNGGATAGKSSDALKNARVLDMTTMAIETLEYPELRKRFDDEFLRVQRNPRKAYSVKYCIVDCEFHNLATNGDIQKRCIVVDSAEAAAEWLSPTAHLRLLFLGSARSIGLGVQWVPVYDPTPHRKRDPHLCSRWCNFFQVDVFSVICGWYESAYYEESGIKYLNGYTGVTERYYANMWMPTVWPWQTVTVVLTGYRNFEIFFKLDRQLDGQTLWAMVRALIKMHTQYGGRSEIRYGAPEGAICLDVSMNKEFGAPFRVINQLGAKTVALHPGKMNDPRDISTRPCKRVPIGQI